MRCADLATTSYFDDFSQLELLRLASSAEATFKGIFIRLGLKLSEDPKKDLEFKRRFEPLGVEVDFSRSSEGLVIIAPKATRVAKVVEMARAAMKDGSLGFKEASTLQGILRFLREGLFGRVGGRLLHALGAHERRTSQRQLGGELRESLE